MELLLDGFATALTPTNLLFAVIGVLLGTRGLVMKAQREGRLGCVRPAQVDLEAGLQNSLGILKTFRISGGLKNHLKIYKGL